MARVLSAVGLPPVTAAIAVVLALAALELVHRALRRIGRRRPLVAEFAERTHRPAQFLLALAVVHFTLWLRTSTGQWRGAFFPPVCVGGVSAPASPGLAGALGVLGRGAVRRPPADHGYH